ncbi:MAG: NAD(P)/FAD-dependent oxidoreductase [Erythrobacter sp.]
MKRLLVIGGGFAGVRAAQVAASTALAENKPLQITLLTEADQLTIRPRLYLADRASWCVPLRPALEPLGIGLKTGSATSIQIEDRLVEFDTGSGEASLSYDALVIATGSRLNWPDVPGLKETTLNLDTMDAASEMIRHIEGLGTDENAASFVVIGAGFTGLEIATELRSTLESIHGAERAEQARIFLVDRNAAPSLGSNVEPVLFEALALARIETRFGRSVTRAARGYIELNGGERISASTIIYSGGLEARPLATSRSLPRDALGRILTDDFLRAGRAEEIFVAGDAAHAAVDDSGRTALMSCQHAIPMGHAAGRNAAAHLLGVPLDPYRQPVYVTCLDLGVAGAVFATGWDRQPTCKGSQAKAIKAGINAMIAPPSGSAEAIMDAVLAV